MLRDNSSQNKVGMVGPNRGIPVSEAPHITYEAINKSQICIFVNRKEIKKFFNYFEKYFNIINTRQTASHFELMEDPSLIENFKSCQIKVIRNSTCLTVSFENTETNILPDQSVLIDFLKQMVSIRKKRSVDNWKDGGRTFEITSTKHPVLIEVKTPEEKDVSFLYGKFRFKKHVVWEKIFSRKLERGVSKLQLEENVLKFIEQYNDDLNKMNYTIKDVVNVLVLRLFSNVAKFPSEIDERLVKFAEEVLEHFAEPQKKQKNRSSNKTKIHAQNTESESGVEKKRYQYEVKDDDSLIYNGLGCKIISLKNNNFLIEIDESQVGCQFVKNKFRVKFWEKIFLREQNKSITRLCLQQDARQFIEEKYNEVFKNADYTIKDVFKTLVLKLLSTSSKNDFPSEVNDCLKNIAEEVIRHVKPKKVRKSQSKARPKPQQSPIPPSIQPPLFQAQTQLDTPIPLQDSGIIMFHKDTSFSNGQGITKLKHDLASLLGKLNGSIPLTQSEYSKLLEVHVKVQEFFLLQYQEADRKKLEEEADEAARKELAKLAATTVREEFEEEVVAETVEELAVEEFGSIAVDETEIAEKGSEEIVITDDDEEKEEEPELENAEMPLEETEKEKKERIEKEAAIEEAVKKSITQGENQFIISCTENQAVALYQFFYKSTSTIRQGKKPEVCSSMDKELFEKIKACNFKVWRLQKRTLGFGICIDVKDKENKNLDDLSFVRMFLEHILILRAKNLAPDAWKSKLRIQEIFKKENEFFIHIHYFDQTASIRSKSSEMVEHKFRYAGWEKIFAHSNNCRTLQLKVKARKFIENRLAVINKQVKESQMKEIIKLIFAAMMTRAGSRLRIEREKAYGESPTDKLVDELMGHFTPEDRKRKRDRVSNNISNQDEHLPLKQPVRQETSPSMQMPPISSVSGHSPYIDLTQHSGPLSPSSPEESPSPRKKQKSSYLINFSLLKGSPPQARPFISSSSTPPLRKGNKG